MWHRSIQASYCSDPFLNGNSWLPTVLSMLEDIYVPHQYHIIKNVIDVLLDKGDPGSATAAFNPLAVQRCVLHRKGFSSSVPQVVARATQPCTTVVCQQYWKEWASWCAPEGVPNDAISVPKLAEFIGSLISGLSDLAQNWYLSFCYFRLLEHHHHHYHCITSNHLIILK